jgi:hypothetical protein
MQSLPGYIPCKLYAEDAPILTIDSIVICQTYAKDLRRMPLKMHPGVIATLEVAVHTIPKPSFCAWISAQDYSTNYLNY